MYKIPENSDLSTIKNQVISQIAFTLNFITIFFDKGFIQFSGGFSFNFSDQSNIYDEVYPVKNDLGLLRILEKKITNIDINNNRDKLTIHFEDKSELCLIGNKFYESFIINCNGNEIRV
ncbi:MAG: hypothetical protein ABI374_08630 [Ginsengibacter sp.]